MFSLEFMFGGSVFTLIHLFITIVSIYVIYLLVVEVYKAKSEGRKIKPLKYEIFALVVSIVLSIYIGSNSSPKIAIEPAVNRQLIEYKEQTPPEIITPKPRVEYLDGFKPLKD